MGPISLEQLREFAKLNMDETCFQKYLQLIEPNIKQIIRNYFGGWKSIESYATQIIMRVNGVYKTSTSVIFDVGDDREKFADLVDLKKYQKFEKFSFKRKIDVLLEQKIIGENTYKLLDFIRKKRNKIHDYDGYISDEDRRWFDIGLSILADVYFSVSSPHSAAKELNSLRENAEKRATVILKELVVKKNL